ncbi:VanW family protein [Virgibacillus salexigens]|uniref:Vancomycin B-type resistance protein VanW n=1 Tax=Virgibacillus massiliensis TaxID=1462526 RepID=A0A024QCS9_9BACI|nr:VanW family protein [Virgibacillus massiliensis]CDQ40314.1 Vancomycin B-type resistance protein VanW [Virgibacillus massiliensis]
MKLIKICCVLLIIFLPYNLSAEETEDTKPIYIEKLEVDQYSLDYTDTPFINQDKLATLLTNLKKRVYEAPTNAKIADDGRIISEKPGFTIDEDQFHIQFRETFYNHDAKGFHVPTQPIYPRVDKALLEEIRTNQLGSYVTYFKKGNKERSHNIALAAEAINNHVIFPGEVFSFNEVVGERTTNRGYKRAPVIVKGELSEGIGGGICQVSSTLFNAVDLKGIQIVERYAHSRSVPYVPPGRDATVSWWGPDFTFKNKYNQPVLIRAKAGNGKMMVRIFSSESAEHFTGNRR